MARQTKFDPPFNRCPRCGANPEMHDAFGFESDLGSVWQQVSCLECGCQWDEVYVPEFMEVTQEPEFHANGRVKHRE